MQQRSINLQEVMPLYTALHEFFNDKLKAKEITRQQIHVSLLILLIDLCLSHNTSVEELAEKTGENILSVYETLLRINNEPTKQ